MVRLNVRLRDQLLPRTIEAHQPDERIVQRQKQIVPRGWKKVSLAHVLSILNCLNSDSKAPPTNYAELLSQTSSKRVLRVSGKVLLCGPLKEMGVDRL